MNSKNTEVFVVNEWCFVRSSERARWLRLDRSAAFTICPQCGARPGEPCDGVSSKVSYVHFQRKNEHKLQRELAEKSAPVRADKVVILVVKEPS